MHDEITKSRNHSNQKFILRNAIYVIAAIALVAFILRITVCAELADNPSVCNPNDQTDMATYARLAAEISKGQWPDHFDYQPFYYTMFLPFCRMLSGDSPWACMILQALLGALAVWLTGITATRLFGRIPGICAALLLGLSKMHVFYTPFMLFEVLQSFWTALILWFACIVWKRNKIWQWSLLALLVSVSALTRGNAVLLVPGLLALICWRNWKQYAKIALLIVLSLALYILPQLPYSIRNYKYAGRWCGASTAGEKVLALGNTPEAPPGGLEYPLTFTRWCEQAERRPEDGRVSMFKNILKWIGKEPGVFLELKFRALLLFWDHNEIANNVAVYNEGQDSMIMRKPILLSFSIIGSLALLGFLFVFRRLRRRGLGFRAPELYILSYMMLASWFGTAMFYNLARFRIAALPLICVAGGAGIKIFLNIRQIFKTVENQQQRRQMLQTCSLPILFSVFLVYSGYSSYQTLIEPAAMRVYRRNGLVVDFPDTMLLYDHGPFSFGGFNYVPVDREALTIVKTLHLPKDAPHGKATVRFPVYIEKDGSLNGSLKHADRTYYFGMSSIKTERFLKWIELELPEIVNDDEGNAHFEWTFAPSPNFGVGVDRLRNYKRTQYIRPNGEKLNFAPEGAMEIQWYKK